MEIEFKFYIAFYYYFLIFAQVNNRILLIYNIKFILILTERIFCFFVNTFFFLKNYFKLVNLNIIYLNLKKYFYTEKLFKIKKIFILIVRKTK